MRGGAVSLEEYAARASKESAQCLRACLRGKWAEIAEARCTHYAYLQMSARSRHRHLKRGGSCCNIAASNTSAEMRMIVLQLLTDAVLKASAAIDMIGAAQHCTGHHSSIV